MRAGEALRKLVCPDDVSCMLCGAETGMGSGTGLCEKCRKGLIGFDGERIVRGTPLYAAYEYHGAAATLIHGLKYENKRYMALPLVRGLEAVFVQTGLEADGIMAVPLHKKRLKQRGFNQSELLAAGLSERLGVPLLRQAILRVRDTKQQVGLDEAERWQNVEGAFSCGENIAGRHVILLDDVCTTGATLLACAQALQQQGAVVTLMAAATVEIDENRAEHDRKLDDLH